MNSGSHCNQDGRGSCLLAKVEPKNPLVLTSTKACKWRIWYGQDFSPSNVEFAVDAGLEAHSTTLKLSLEKFDESNFNLPPDKYAKLTFECCSSRGEEMLYMANVSIDEGRRRPRTIHESGLKSTAGACLVPLKYKNTWITLEIEITVNLYSNGPGGSLVDIWNNRHQSPLTRDLLENGNLSDVKIISKEGQEFYAHKLILRVQNEVFDAMFRHDMMESQTGVVKLDDMSGKAVKFLLNFIYSSHILKISGKEDDQVSGEDVTIAEVLYLVDKFGLEELKTFLDENMEKFCEGGNVWYLFKLCKLHSLQKGKKVIFDVMKEKNSDFLEEFVFSHA